MTRHAMLPTLLPLALAACAVSPPPVPVVGPAPDVAALAGHWSGEYGSPLTGRSGTIEFTVAAQGDSASGVVVMIPAGFGHPLQPWTDPVAEAGRGSPPTPSSLTIRLVQVKGKRVTGSLTPYRDPETGAQLITTFEGGLAADTIAGTFTTHPGAPEDRPTGHWRVTRERP